VAAGPKMGETVILGEAVAFGDRPEAASPEGTASGEIVTGQDVADKLDSILGPDPLARTSDETILSTESLLPSGWQVDAPQVTGADVEAQLDKLFNLEPDSLPAGVSGGPAPQADPTSPGQGNLNDTVAFMGPVSPMAS